MKKIKLVVLLFLVSSAVALLIFNGELIRVLSIILSYPNYLVVVADEFYGSLKLQEFINLKKSQGFNVEVKRVSDIYNMYPQSNTVSFLKVKNFEMINYTTFYGVYALWFDGKQYKINAYRDSDGFAIVNPPTEFKEVCLFIRGEGSGTISLQFDGGKVLTLSVSTPSGFCYAWGMPFVTVDGKIYYNKTKADSIRSYIVNSPNVQYVLLVGSTMLVPAYYLREISSDKKVYTGMTDHPYTVKNIDSNPLMSPEIMVGRLPVNTVSELETVLNKILMFKAEMSKRNIIIKGSPLGTPPELWNLVYDELKNSINNSLHIVYPNSLMYELIEPTKEQAVSVINMNNDNIVFYAHGSTGLVAICSPSLTVSDMDKISFINNTVIFAVSCSTGDLYYVNGKSLAEAFLVDSDSKVTAYIGASLLARIGSSVELCRYFYSYLYSRKTVGDSLLKAEQASINADPFILYDRLIWNLFGDPSLYMLPGEIQPPQKYGWLSLSTYVNGQLCNEIIEYTVTFPNDTKKSYVSNTEIIIYNCPVGTYFIVCKHPTLGSKELTTIVEEDCGTKAVFNFMVEKKPVGTIRIRSNVQCIVDIYPLNESRYTPFDLVDVPVGKYVFTARINIGEPFELRKTHEIVLNEGEDITYTFEFEVYSFTTPFTEYLFRYFPLCLFVLAFILVIKW